MYTMPENLYAKVRLMDTISSRVTNVAEMQ